MSTHDRVEHGVGVGERVGQDQAAFGVGVQHLDGAAAEVRDDVPGRSADPDGMFSAAATKPVTRA